MFTQHPRIELNHEYSTSITPLPLSEAASRTVSQNCTGLAYRANDHSSQVAVAAAETEKIDLQRIQSNPSHEHPELREELASCYSRCCVACQTLAFRFVVHDRPTTAVPLQISDQEINFTVSKDVTDNILLYYFKGPSFDDQVVLKLEDGLSLIEQENFEINNSTIFFFHGWGENATDGSAEDVITAFLDMKIRNLVAFDYSKLVRNNGKILNYPRSVFNASHIGQALGIFFKAYIPDKQPLNLVKLVSHSLGSQIMAKTARTFGIGKLARLTALDPAGPLYNIPGIKHLDAKDGKFVDVIHTDGGFFGDGRTIGTVDFFPNGGTRDQPGCYESLQNITSACSHGRSHKYYAESIRNPKAFLAKTCKRTNLFQHCCCNNSNLAYMGYYVNTGIHGTYFLKTNAEEPFGEGVNGTNFS